MAYHQHFSLVVGITGLKASGKDELSGLLRDRGFNVCRISDAVREECAKRGINDPTVQQLQDIGDWGRTHSGDCGYWAGRLVEMMSREGNPYGAINGIRNPGEVEALRRLVGPNFLLVGITAPTWIRYQRAMKREQGGDPSEMAGFLEMDDRDRGIGQPFDGQQVDRCLAMVEPYNFYCNSGSLEEYANWMKKLLDRCLAQA